MKRLINILIFVLLILVSSCTKDDYTIEYAEGYPHALADNWIAFEFQGGDIDGDILEPYNLVTALDPNTENKLIIDQLYNSDIRVRTSISDTGFSVNMGEQLNLVSTNNYGVKYITIKGYVTDNPVLTNFAYTLASSFYRDIAFYESDIKDILFMRAGFYDSFQSRIDSVLIIGYRKTGFENVDY